MVRYGKENGTGRNTPDSMEMMSPNPIIGRIQTKIDGKMVLDRSNARSWFISGYIEQSRYIPVWHSGAIILNFAS